LNGVLEEFVYPEGQVVTQHTQQQTPYYKNSKKNLRLSRMNAQVRARRQQAEARLEQAIEGIPGAEEIFDAIVTDWILNVEPADLNNFEVEHMREAVEGAFDQGQVPDIAGNQYLVLTDAFKQFVRDYYGVGGGKRSSHSGKRSSHSGKRSSKRGKKTRKHKKHSKKTRKH
jgi:hypothetical protein